jgi:mannan endo-1,4-beta-mannosidase
LRWTGVGAAAVALAVIGGALAHAGGKPGAMPLPAVARPPVVTAAGASPLGWAPGGAAAVPGGPPSPGAAGPARAAAPSQAAVFADPADGYALVPPAGWTFDASLLPDVARWNTADASLRVYAQPVADAEAAATYVGYSNRAVDQGWNGIRLLASSHAGDTWFRRWERPAMPLLRPDMREYAEWDRLMTNGRVLTVMVNATGTGFAAAYAAAESVVASLRAIPTHGANAFAIPHAASRPAPLVPATPGVSWGVYEPSLDVAHPSLLPVDRLQRELGADLKVVMVYLSIGDPFPTALLRQAQAEGRIVELTLQSWAPHGDAGRSLPYGHGTSADGAILQGQDDAYLRGFARQAAATGIPFLFRWDNEMNGDWDPWSAFQWGKDTDIYVATYRHVHDVFAAAGALADAAFVWNPNNDDLPAYRWNAAALYYPGDAYVDWVGLTAYNLGTGQPGSAWRSFAQAYGATYARDLALYPGKPLLITEFASNDAGGDKAAWITDMFRVLPDFPAIRYAVWWDADQGDLHYALAQPPAALAAMRAGLAAAAGR